MGQLDLARVGYNQQKQKFCWEKKITRIVNNVKQEKGKEARSCIQNQKQTR